jgi:hypothetical protein
MSDDQSALREELIFHLMKGNAHMPLDEAVADFPMDRINDVFPNGTYSAWALLEHIRITQWDILDFMRNEHYVHLEWPRDYWPSVDFTAATEDWQKTLAAFQRDRQELVDIVRSPDTSLYARIPWGEGQTVMREVMVVTDHNAYHVGEFAIMRQTMQTWGAAGP